MKNNKCTKENLNKIIESVIKEYYEKPKNENLKEYIINNIDFSDHNFGHISDDKKIRKGIEVFYSEQEHNINRMGFRKAFSEYLRGLPSWLDMPIYYWDIKNLMYSLGYDEVKDIGDDDLDKLYYNEVAKIFEVEAQKGTPQISLK